MDMTDVTEDAPQGQGRVLGALGAVLGVALVGLIVTLANEHAIALVTAVMVGTAVVCPLLLRRPPWRPAGVGVLVGMAGAYPALFALLALWLAGSGPGATPRCGHPSRRSRPSTGCAGSHPSRGRSCPGPTTGRAARAPRPRDQGKHHHDTDDDPEKHDRLLPSDSQSAPPTDTGDSPGAYWVDAIHRATEVSAWGRG